ncbi:MAG: hypothetical protein CVU12_08720 [Bacteroidetes bacterium HGW-Bacteroidetes-7]|jgi:hypothetical protein|nr:MAG: hypothetical protein CVU12_08720 [Bacteroidetes bacterium HGW-Bacteroidetes-7]
MKYKVVFMLAASLMLLTCTKPEPDAPNPPGNNPPGENPPPPPTYNTSATIGTTGGKLTDVTLEVNIESGTFSKPYPLEVKKATAGASFSEYESSTFYEVKGVPVNFTKPIKVTITPATGSPDNLLMTVTEEKYIPSQRKIVQTSVFVNATKSGTTYVCDYTPYAGAGTLRDTTLSVKFGLVKNYELLPATKADSKFKMYAPTEYKGAAFDLRDYLDQIYDIIKNDLQFSYAERTSWPMSVTVKKFPSGQQNVFGYFCMSPWSHNYSSMEFNATQLTSTTELRATAGHEFFHFAKSLYGTMSTAAMLVSNDPFYWLDEASSVWFEALATGQSGYNPLVRQGHHLEPLKGVYKGPAENAEHYGYGMGAFVKYLVQKYGSTSLVNMYSLIKAKSVSTPVEAVNQAHATTFEQMYTQFLEDYIGNKIYTDFQSSSLLTNTTAAFNIATEADTLMTYERDYEALSAQIYRVNFSYDKLMAGDALSITASGLGQFLVYQASASGIVLMGKAYDEFIIENLKDLKDRNARILVVKPNLSLTKEKQTVEFKVEKGLAFDAVWAKIYIRGNFSGDIASSIAVEVPLQVRSDDWPNYPLLSGKYSTATKIFTASYSGNSVVCEFDMKNNKVSGSVTLQNNDVSFSSRAVKASVSFSDLTLSEWDGKSVIQYLSYSPKGSVNIVNCQYTIGEIQTHTLINATEVNVWIYFGMKK